ncbi:MAG: Anaerobic nitric oxide reductase flavorubredoxin [Frankiales bacterium]|nr:Anaerobic nitric oxide reductase flavorubredoxin [Frankiales bacterium]
MKSKVDQIADRVYRISTCIPEIAPGGFTFNQFLVDADEPLLYHTGMRGLFPLVSEAIEKVMPLERLRWVSFAHVEADECGAVNDVLAAAPNAQVVHGALGCQLSLNDLCHRPPRGLADGEVLELGGAGLKHRVLGIPTPHVPHNWESHVLYEEESGTLFCGDLLTQIGDGPAVTAADLLDQAIQAEELFRQTSLGRAVPETYRRLADLEPRTLAVMHGSSYNGDCAALLRRMADVYEQQFGCGSAEPVGALPAHAAAV